MTDRSPLPIRVTLAFFPLTTGLAALWLGQDASWDLRNYHFYNAFSFLAGRMGFDVAAAQVATYYNPLLHLPFYYAVTTLAPKMVAFILGLIPGLNIFFLYGIARRVTPNEDTPRAQWFCLAVAVTGLLGAATVSELGTSFGDNIVSLLVLCALWWVLKSHNQYEKLGAAKFTIIALVSGLISGAALGLKQPFAVYAVGMCAAFFGLSFSFQKRFFFAFVFGLGVLDGIALTGGFWMIEMWHHFKNPLFPYFNEYFKSPWAAPAAYRDIRFIPDGFFEWLTYPIGFTLNPMKVGEVPFRDLRFFLLYLLVLAWPLGFFLSGSRRAAVSTLPAHRFEARFILIFIAVSFIFWMKLFSIYRYLVVCEMLAPLGLFLLSAKISPSFRRQMTISLGAFILILATLIPGDWGRRPFGADYFGVQAPALSNPSTTMVLMTGHEPMAYMIPFFPAEVRFLRVQSYLTGPTADRPNAMNRLMAEAIASHSGELYLMYRSFEEWTAMETMKTMRIQIEKDRCIPFLPHVEPLRDHPYYFCPVLKEPKN